jgi:uncharacterized protein (TIGR03067 family)
MKTFTMLTVSILLVLPLATSADDAKQQLEKLQGTWTSVSYEIGGTKIEGDNLKAVVESITIKGEAFAWKAGSSNDKGTIKIDATQNPKHIDFVLEQEEGVKVTTWVGIYSLEGDTLKFCVRPGVGDRPKDFSTQNVIYGVFTFKRAK